ncbi:VanZ family protein [Streptococcus catagoni]|uniref:VanZ family protein n=1 Tax=Streptococcus catagoni TaxID=2654874 RepID=UPI00140BCA88|nr:VanZ family protein [Streptococcus catagoni]
MIASKKVTTFLFCLYLLLLTWCVLFKFETQFQYINFFQEKRMINWILFTQPLIVNGDIVFAEMGFNLLFFVPLGVSLPLMFPKWSYVKIIGSGFLLSLIYESLQFILAIGKADVTDLLFNTLGLCIGLLLYPLLVKLFKNRVRFWINVIGIVCIGIPAIGLILFVIIGLLV